MPSHPFIKPGAPDKRDSINRNFPWFQGPPMSNAEAHARSQYQSPPPAPTLPAVAVPPSPELVSPRSQRSLEKQRAVTPTQPPVPPLRVRNTTLSANTERDSMDILPPIHIVASARDEQTYQDEQQQTYTMQTNRNLCYPQQSARDPSLYHLGDPRKTQISAPVQPRLTDIRAHIERDPSYSSPTYDLHISFKLKMQPGDLH